MNEKHIDIIQSTINRHNSNSFLLRGWAITLTAALFALTSGMKVPSFAFISIGPIILFWTLDSMYLANERSFISLYNCVINGNKLKLNKGQVCNNHELDLNSNENDAYRFIQIKDFSMDITPFKIIKRNNFSHTFFSKIMICFYPSLLLFTSLLYVILLNMSDKEITKNVNNKDDILKIELVNFPEQTHKIIICDSLELENR